MQKRFTTDYGLEVIVTDRCSLRRKTGDVNVDGEDDEVLDMQIGAWGYYLLDAVSMRPLQFLYDNLVVYSAIENGELERQTVKKDR